MNKQALNLIEKRIKKQKRFLLITESVSFVMYVASFVVMFFSFTLHNSPNSMDILLILSVVAVFLVFRFVFLGNLYRK